ncbi:MAG: lipoprotein-releasing ABC transporter permease subunit [Desulfobacterales bacterium]|nr:lipoprotein-releasing ABC transporter permease subunit [Desulfobacterales bacterium]MCP4160948.1 lipoprotein-releasing ABC transporter permease subunit [Deltaproteobacteria bacterium]
MSFENFIAGRYLKAKRKEKFISLISILSIFGIAIGVTALIAVMAVMTGAEADFRSKILGVESHLTILHAGGRLNNDPELIKTISETKGVNNVTPYISNQVMIRTSKRVKGIILRGIDPSVSSTFIKDIKKESLVKKLDGKGASAGIILGEELAKSLNVIDGDKLYIISPQGMLLPIGHSPSIRRFIVKGTFTTGMNEYDSSLAYINLENAQSFFGLGNKVNAIGVWVDEINDVEKVKSDIFKKISFPYWSRDWKQRNSSLFAALKLEKVAMNIILILIVIVAAFNIASTLIMMVMDKTKDIAILKTMGANTSSIRRIFIAQGMVIGLLGTLSGVVLGIITCYLLKNYLHIDLPKAYPFTTLPVKLELFDILSVALSSIAISFLSTLYPSYQASKQNPVEAIRYG